MEDIGTVSMDLEALIRDDGGRFQAHCAEAARKSVEEAVAEGRRVAIALAPKKTERMASTIRARTNYVIEAAGVLNASAEVSVGTNYWRYQEYGTRPHLIYGMVRFFWELENREWNPDYNYIKHPGNPAKHFMEYGFLAAQDELERAVHRNYR